ncbi:hypothetical protein L6452_20881 [Arctium lappa]|uniref:Uncharacterized protein n=1 Tax=Arctium lappa TaxID=4217 RepID=A0ACB9BC68_ARCLA|nr:hypothetical protein L6452_20881 [Arctium lappa]
MADEEAPAPALDDTRSERDSKHARRSRVGSGSVPSPTDSRKRRNDGIDMNKKPNRMKKHRPKVYDDSKPKKVPSVSTPGPKTPNPVQERKNTFTNCMQNSTSKQKKVPMAQSPRASTPRPKTPKPTTPNQVQERMKHPRKCKRSLDFNYHRGFHHISEQPPSFGEFDCFGNIVTSNSNTLRRSCRLEDNNKQQCWERIISIIRNQVRAEKHVGKLVYCYQRRKKSSSMNTTSFIPMLQVYQRKLRENQCLQSSKKNGPDFPRMFKKQRAKRKKSATIGNWWYIQAVIDGKSHAKTSHRKHIQTTAKGVHNKVNKFKKRKPLHARKRENDLSTVKTMHCESEKCRLQQDELQDLNNLDVKELIKDLIVKIENLDINGQCKELVVQDPNVLVKRKVLPKVELDEETLRTWKLLMENDHGSKPSDQETDKDNEERWERQRKVFRGRVDSFIAKMHLIQGNRRFSPWKGSVVDSVVGAYLTQNVSDHLSSSAFMSLVARFPVKSRGMETEKDMRTSCAEPTTKPKEEGDKNEHPKHSESEFVDAVNDHHIPLDTGKKKSRIEEKQQETKTDWERLRRSYCKTGGKGTSGDNMHAVDWDAVRRATVEEIAKTIVERGMNNKLAARIKVHNYFFSSNNVCSSFTMVGRKLDYVLTSWQAFLERMVKDHGTIDLEWLRDVPPDKAKEFLLSIRGIGLKSVECIRLLTLHHLAFPVDTNVGRVATRLGWVPLQPLPEEVQIHLLNSTTVLSSRYELHYQLITFGKVFCTKRTPNCNACPMRAECRHYASAFASARFTLPGLKESGVTSIVPAANEQNHGILPSFADLQSNNLSSSYDPRNKEPIIEVPPSPEPDVEETLPTISDIEDLFSESDDEIPTIRLNTQELRETLKDTISLPEADMSKALVAFTTQPASIPRMKFVAKLRTVHFVYELPDSHPILAGFDKREHDDPSPYLLSIWLPGEIEYTENIACNSSNEETVKGTVLIPCRTATRGKFPLNGTYFQVNEVFADDETSRIPMDVPRCKLWNLPRRHLGCGTSATSIFKGSICVRGFNRRTRHPRPLHRRFHISTTAVAADGKRIWKK